MKKIFVYKSEIFNSEILICVGSEVKDMIKWADKYSDNLKGILKGEENCKLLEELINTSIGFVKVFQKDGIDFYVLWLKDYINKWTQIDVLNHEIVHLRQFLFINKSISEELEFEAYFQENTFRELRKMLNKYLK